MQALEGLELQGHGVGAGLGGVAILEAVVVVVLDRVLVLIQREGPETVEVDLVAEARGQGVHQEAGGGSFDVHLVGQPVSETREERNKKGDPSLGMILSRKRTMWEARVICLGRVKLMQLVS